MAYRGTFQGILIDTAHPSKQGRLDRWTNSYRLIAFRASNHGTGDMELVESKSQARAVHKWGNSIFLTVPGTQSA